jgi:hypothetical protein
VKKFTSGKFMIRNIDPDLWKRFQMICLEKDTYPNYLMLEILEDYVKKNYKRIGAAKRR